MITRRFPASVVLVLVLAGAFAAAREQAQTIAGATNFCRIDTNFASGGITTADAYAQIKAQGFRTVVDLRTAEEGADLKAEGEVVRNAGMAYVSLPFNTGKPDDAMVTRFVDLARNQANLPLYVHCRSGQRANAFLMVKRVLVDGWTVEKATEEAASLGLNPQLRAYATSYVKAHGVR